jgi:AcrR family transcriptional regulator
MGAHGGHGALALLCSRNASAAFAHPTLYEDPAVPHVHKTSREAILKVASALADAEGLRGVGVRAIAARLGISPGTLYNVIGDIDDIVLHVNAQTLIRLRDSLQAAIVAGRDAMSNVFAVAEAYVDFVRANPKRWSMLFEYSLASGKDLPGWYRETLDQTVATVDQLLRPMIPARNERQRVVAVLWAALEGVASLAASGKLSVVNDDDPHVLVRLLVSRFLGSFQSEEIAEKPRPPVGRPPRRKAAAKARRVRE